MKDASRDNGMMTKIWGPPGWMFLHAVTFGYPYKIDPQNLEHLRKKESFRRFFLNVGKVLPCKYCRESYDRFVEEVPIDPYLNSREDLCYWFYMIHNRVNDKLGVPKCNIPNFEEVKKKYETFRAKCKKTTRKDRERNLRKKCISKDDPSTKGCVIPEDGVLKKCEIKIVKGNGSSNLISFRLHHILIGIGVLFILNVVVIALLMH